MTLPSITPQLYTDNIQEQMLESQQRNESSAPVEKICENFFSARNITFVKQRPKRKKFVSPFVAGSLQERTFSVPTVKRQHPKLCLKISKNVQIIKTSTKKFTT